MDQPVCEVDFGKNNNVHQNKVHAESNSMCRCIFLRLLAAPGPPWAEDYPAITLFKDADEVTVVDFGCGIAPPSISPAERLGSLRTQAPPIADIPSIRRDFVRWLPERDLGYRALIANRVFDTTRS